MCPDKPKLTERQEDFCSYYVQCNNAYESAINAGYAQSTAKANSYKLLDMVGVKERIRELKEARSDISTATIERKKQHLLDIAYAKDTKPAESIKALHEHSLMCGDHAAAKLDINGIGEPRIVFMPHPSIQINQIDWPGGMPLLLSEVIESVND